MALLKYIGKDERTDWVPGWPASSHDELDAELAAEKVASGLYEAVTRAAGEAVLTRGRTADVGAVLAAGAEVGIRAREDEEERASGAVSGKAAGRAAAGEEG